MQVPADKLAARIERDGLAKAYLIFGDEPLQIQECADAVRHAARATGISERQVFELETGFDWHQLLASANELSLFAEQRIIELRLNGRKPDKTGTEVLQNLLGQTDSSDIFLFTSNRIDRSTQQSKWFKAIDKAGVSVTTWLVKPNEMPGWIVRRARSLALKLSPEAAELLALRAEGNLLAAAQELDKLQLLVDTDEIDVDTVMGAIADSARYDVFGLIDVAMGGDKARAIRMLRGLRQEGTEAVVIGWAVNRELRNLSHVAASRDNGMSLQAALGEQKIWESRAGLVRKVLERIPSPRLRRLLEDSMRLDRIIKGAQVGDAWNELELLLLRFAGRGAVN